MLKKKIPRRNDVALGIFFRLVQQPSRLSIDFLLLHRSYDVVDGGYGMAVAVAEQGRFACKECSLYLKYLLHMLAFIALELR